MSRVVLPSGRVFAGLQPDRGEPLLAQRRELLQSQQTGATLSNVAVGLQIANTAANLFGPALAGALSSGGTSVADEQAAIGEAAAARVRASGAQDLAGGRQALEEMKLLRQGEVSEGQQADAMVARSRKSIEQLENELLAGKATPEDQARLFQLLQRQDRDQARRVQTTQPQFPGVQLVRSPAVEQDDTRRVLQKVRQVEAQMAASDAAAAAPPQPANVDIKTLSDVALEKWIEHLAAKAAANPQYETKYAEALQEHSRRVVAQPPIVGEQPPTPQQPAQQPASRIGQPIVDRASGAKEPGVDVAEQASQQAVDAAGLIDFPQAIAAIKADPTSAPKVIERLRAARRQGFDIGVRAQSLTDLLTGGHIRRAEAQLASLAAPVEKDRPVSDAQIALAEQRRASAGAAKALEDRRRAAPTTKVEVEKARGEERASAEKRAQSEEEKKNAAIAKLKEQVERQKRRVEEAKGTANAAKEEARLRILRARISAAGARTVAQRTAARAELRAEETKRKAEAKETRKPEKKQADRSEADALATINSTVSALQAATKGRGGNKRRAQFLLPGARDILIEATKKGANRQAKLDELKLHMRKKVPAQQE